MSGTESSVGTTLLGIVGGGTVTPLAETPKPPLPEPFRTLKAEFLKLVKAGKSATADESRKPYFPVKKMNETAVRFNKAIQDLDQNVAESSKNELDVILRDAEKEIGDDLVKIKRKDYYRLQIRDIDEAKLRTLARADARLDKAEAECLAAIKKAKTDFKDNSDKIYEVTRSEIAVNAYVNERNASRKSETIHIDDVIDAVGQDAETTGSLAWFNKIRDQAELEPEPTDEQLKQQAQIAEWNLVKQDVAAQWAAFVGSGYDFAYRGPTMPSQLRTPYVLQVCTAGKVYRIANKAYKVGPSDTGGMSLKTDIPVKHQGYNSTGGWVQSFIYHIGS